VKRVVGVGSLRRRALSSPGTVRSFDTHGAILTLPCWTGSVGGPYHAFGLSDNSVGLASAVSGQVEVWHLLPPARIARPL
jgi:hypothetical protein